MNVLSDFVCMTSDCTSDAICPQESSGFCRFHNKPTDMGGSLGVVVVGITKVGCY